MTAINITWWNLQNFFDTDDDPISKDFEFTPEKGWTEEVFNAKKGNLATVLCATHNNSGPELLAVAEIESDELLEQLIQAMDNQHLQVVKDPGGTSDLRGIDVAMAYDDRKLRVYFQKSHLIHLRYRTRDIFEVGFEVVNTNERFTVFANHWPSRRVGRYQSDPIRIAAAEHLAYLVEDHVKVSPEEYEQLRAEENIQAVIDQWNSKVLLMGDFNDEPADRSMIEHLKASNDLDRVIGQTNDIDGFEDQTADYREQDVFLFNPMWRFLTRQKLGTYFIDYISGLGKTTNRYQLLDQIIVSRGLLGAAGLRLDLDSLEVFSSALVATDSGRPKPFNKNTKKGTSDHLPLIARLVY